MKPLIRLILVFIAFNTCSMRRACAAVLVPPLFGNNMVLQQSKLGLPPVAIWGWADEGEKVTITFRGREYPRSRRFASRVRKNGRWEIKLGQLKPQGPERLEIIGNNSKIVLTNVVVGDLWVIGTKPPTRALRPKTVTWNPGAVRLANRLRFLPAKHWTPEGLKPDPLASWAVSSPDPTAFPAHSSLAFYLGHTLMQEEGDRFIGIIETSAVGLGSLRPADRTILERMRGLNSVHEASYRSWRRADTEYHEELQAYNLRKEAANLEGREFTELPPEPLPWTKNICWGGLAKGSKEALCTLNGFLW